MTRHHTEPNTNCILLTGNLSFGSEHPCSDAIQILMIPFHCLWAKSNNRTRGQFECDVLGFVLVLILFVHMHGAVVVP